MGSAEEDRPANENVIESMKKKWQYVMDKLSPQIALRWAIFSGTFFIYFLRVYLAGAWYIVTYALGIYLLNQLIGFLSPQLDPEEDGVDISLPVTEKEEYRYLIISKFFKFLFS